MADRIVIRPSTKLVLAGYVLVVLVLLALAIAVYVAGGQYFAVWHLAALALFYFPVKRHVATRLISLTIEGDHLTIESGLVSRSRRTFDLAKIQNVTANQSVGQRLLGTGDLMLETAGERSAMFMKAIDNPRTVADDILARSREAVRNRIQGGLG
jgi:uncharacterized membrane protein YdbT with pleckstrin-like domain